MKYELILTLMTQTTSLHQERNVTSRRELQMRRRTIAEIQRKQMTHMGRM
jgi:hypothetical protein